MNIENRDYKFTDEQVRALGFSSYEELEMYYDLEYMNMEDRPWTKEECESEIKNAGLEHRLDYSRRDRLKSSISDRIGVITDWDATSWIPTSEEIASEREGLNRVLDVYFKFAERQAKIDLENSDLSAPKFGGR